ncbi:putative F-box protein At4g22030 [Tasmannia lanceolata]|uniref:putative F-box protein At4g22030 n=1 Tax=Tasmannia lanceolata TaxID=3420 RepID=UPI004063F500
MTTTHIPTEKCSTTEKTTTRDDDSMASLTKLYAIAEAVSDRVEMHTIIGEQRNNWNFLLVSSINAITLSAATMAGLSAIPPGEPLLAFKLSSTLLYLVATGLFMVVNKIQPSQLAEEQRNAAKLFRHLHTQIQTILALRTPTLVDLNDVMERVLAIEKAYPLPLLPLLEKFPEKVEPTKWWPSYKRLQKQEQQVGGQIEGNGWSRELEEEMKGVIRILKRKDIAEYVRLGKLVLKVNRILASLGPSLTGVAAVGAALVGSPSVGQWALLAGVTGGALASVVNTLEHGGQVGMVFELFRNCAGFYHLLEESIDSTLMEREVDKRENGELFEMKVALHLGRSLSELRALGSLSSSSSEDDNTSEFAGKLF